MWRRSFSKITFDKVRIISDKPTITFGRKNIVRIIFDSNLSERGFVIFKSLLRSVGHGNYTVESVVQDKDIEEIKKLSSTLMEVIEGDRKARSCLLECFRIDDNKVTAEINKEFYEDMERFFVLKD